MMIFKDRREAGQLLALRLSGRHLENPLVVGLARGGVVVACEVARALGAPLEVLVTRKIGAPFQPEMAIGAIAPGGVQIIDEQAIRILGIPADAVETVIRQERNEMLRRLAAYGREDRVLDVSQRDVIVVDDGLATGQTARAGIASIRAGNPTRIILAVPVSAAETAYHIRKDVDDFVCISVPDMFVAVGQWYYEFEPVGDDEVSALLQEARSFAATEKSGGGVASDRTLGLTSSHEG